VSHIIGQLDGYLESQGGTTVPIIVVRSWDNFKCVLTPQVSGPHALYLNFAGIALPG